MTTRPIRITVTAPPALAWIPPVGEWTQVATGNVADGARGGARLWDQFHYSISGEWYSIYPGNGPMPGPISAATVRGGTGKNGIINYCGATSDPDRREYLMCANGGDGDYGGNETFVLRLNTNTPRWYRLNDPSLHVSRHALARDPNDNNAMKPYTGYVEFCGKTPVFAGTTEYVTDWTPDPLNLFPNSTNWPLYPPDPGNGQQRPRSMHTYGYQHFVKGSDGVGRVWFCNMGSMFMGPGGSPFSLSFNRDQYGELTDNYAPPSYGTGTDTSNPWTYHLGAYDPADNNASMAAYDPVDRRIWRIGSAMNESTYLRFDVAMPGTFNVVRYTAPLIGSGITRNAFSVIAPDLRLWIVGIQGTPARVWIRDITNPATNTGGQIISTITQDGFNWDVLNEFPLQGGVDELPVPIAGQRNVSMSGMYDSASKSVLILNPRGMSGVVRQLLIPTNAQGLYDPNGNNSDGHAGWEWKTFTAGGINSAIYNHGQSPVIPPGSFNYGTWNRAQLLTDVGGATLIVYAEDPQVGTYIYRVR